MAVFAAGLAVLAVKLKEIQVDDAADFNYEKSRQSVRRVQTAGPRGRILDRRGRVLAGNRRCVSISCRPSAFRKRTWDATAAAIAQAVSNAAAVVGRPSRLTARDIRRHVDTSLAVPLVAWSDIDEAALARFSENEWRLEGFFASETEERSYPFGSLACHLIGYVGRERATGDGGDQKFNFREMELCGRSGMELRYNGFLAGVPGERRVLVDARGFTEREWTVAPARRGPDLSLTLDVDIQRAAEAQLAGCRGACVVLDPRDGSVLAFASAPGYDLRAFVPVLPHAVYDGLLKDPAKPLLNRASGGLYAPGSTFKPVTALAGLRLGWPAEEEYECTGVYLCGEMKLRCSRRWGHGPVDMCGAIKSSCNTYFCNLGQDIGTNALCTAARDFGFGAPTGVDFTDDKGGVVPDDAWKRRTYAERWYPGDLAQMSIGQGMLLVTPLQMAVAAGAIGTGWLAVPHVRSGATPVRKALPFDRAHLDVVRRGMRMVVDGGTGVLAGSGVPVAVSGKTGTAEVGAGERRRKNTWFIAYAPADRPAAALALLVEDGESGGGTAAPRAAEVLKAVFGGEVAGAR